MDQDVSNAQIAIDKAAFQDVIFSDNINRSDLLRLKPSWPLKEAKIHVIRNQPFDLIAPAIARIATYAGLQLTFSFSDYDDSINLSEPINADVCILSIDFERYREKFGPEQLAKWISDRIKAIRDSTTAPILVSNAETDIEDFNGQLEADIKNTPSCYLCDVLTLRTQIGSEFIDERTTQLKASHWSSGAIMHLARHFGLSWIPGVVLPSIKAIALDFDNTLYEGVLGEDGVEGICLTEGHRDLQESLVDLSKQGVLLTAVSKNHQDDVLNLLKSRSDFPLKQDHFTLISANWEPKSINITKQADQLNISTDSFLFIDDNMGEIAEVASSIPKIATLYASSPKSVTNALKTFPGLHKFSTQSEDQLRKDDTVANILRKERLENSTDTHEYLKSLDIELIFTINDLSNLERMQELTHKTNQFNLSLARTVGSAIASGIRDETLRAVTVKLQDKLSDSGTIGFLFGRINANGVEILELDISCRALGRGLEDAIVWKSVLSMNDNVQPEFVRFHTAIGPRNQPALEWLKQWVNEPISDGINNYKWDALEIESRLTAVPAKFTEEPARQNMEVK